MGTDGCVSPPALFYVRGDETEARSKPQPCPIEKRHPDPDTVDSTSAMEDVRSLISRQNERPPES